MKPGPSLVVAVAALSGALALGYARESALAECAGSACEGAPARTPEATPDAPEAMAGAVGVCPSGMVRLHAGHFTMADRADNVSVNAFCLDVTEVTTDAYVACIAGGRCTADHLTENTVDGTQFTEDSRCNYNQGRGTHPMNCVDWGQSAAYCAAQGKRLPTEEEWEWAARGASAGTTYPWGNGAPDGRVCWSGGGSKRGGTCAVGASPTDRSPEGVSDLGGNVWEWTSSKEVGDASVRVDRGGCWWYDDASNLRTGVRHHILPAFRDSAGGFRCAR